MPHQHLLGRVAQLTIRRFASPGAFLAIDAADTRESAPVILLPGAEIPEGAAEGDELAVFVHLDSEDRPIATTRAPKLELGEVRFLEVADITSFGAFVDWGLPKQLLVPHKEQTRDVHRGDFHPIGLFLDDTGRLCGTMRVSEMLRDKGEFDLDEWVEAEAWRDEPDIGLFVIVERAFLGLVPKTEPHDLKRGQATQLRVARVHPDGKIELSLRGLAHDELEKDAARVLAALTTAGAPKISESLTPEDIRARFGLSKKAFKRAVGRLLKARAVTIDRDGHLVPVAKA
ncbi:MAG: S1-like domain-containing RNA-binding protein [Polyangiales bacterium]